MELTELELQLDELIEKVKSSKSFKQSIKMKEDFSTAWCEYAERTCFSEKAMNYYYDGFKITWAVPLFEVLTKIKVSSEVLKKFLSLRIETYYPHYAMCIHLFALLINHKNDNQDYYENILIFMTRNFKNKEGKVNGNAVKDFEKYFMSNITEGFVLPDLQNLKLNNNQRNKVGLMFLFCMENLSAETKNKINKEYINLILNWSKQNVIDEEDVKEYNISESKPKTKTIEEKLEDASIQLKNQKETITTLKETISYLQERLNFEQFEKSKYIEELRKVEGKKTNLAYEKVQLQNKITELEQKINSLHEDIESEKKLTKNVTGNNQRQLDAFFYRLSENLKFEYEDFKDALEADMSISLGENMRTQLGNVFKILSDSGIKLE